ncbi:MAG: hypothetical protein ACRDMJ_03440 [Solirubrobacteraceae bacterium]
MTLADLSAALAAEGGALEAALLPGRSVGASDLPDARELASGPPQLAASGPRASEHRDEYELLLEIIFEGSLLHYGSPRVVDCGDADLALLLGDQLYALGLSRLAALGDLEAVSELADVISLVAQAQAADNRGLADAIWDAGAVAIGWGSGPRHEAAKALARAGDARASDALLRFRDAVVGRSAWGPGDAQGRDGGTLTGASDVL